ncbi:MAG: O-antigen ligase family protein, partial [Limisphaerales bacterium]
MLAFPLLLVALVLGFLDYPKFLLLAVFIRSVLDAFTNSALPIGPLHLNLAGLLGLSLVFFTPFHCFKKNGLFKFPVVRGFSIFLLLSIPAILSAFRHFGVEGAVALKEFIRLASLFCLLISLLVFFRTPAETKKLFYAALASLAIPLAVGFYQAATGTGDTVSTDGQNRIFGTLFHPNTFSLYLTVFIAVSLAWHKSAPALGKKILLGALLLAQFLTYSMGALAATGVVLAVHLWQSKNSRAWWGVLFLFLLPALTFFSENWQLRFNQLARMELAEEIQAREISNSMSWRVLHWYVLLQYSKEHPITGWGLLTTEKITPWRTAEGQGFAAHNDLVRLFLETGLVGVAGYFIFLYGTGRWIFGRRKEPDGP